MPCPKAAASKAIDLLALFESVTGEIFADTPGTLLASRVCGLGKVMGNITRDVLFDPPLVQYSKRSRSSWNRRASRSLDVTAWRLRVQELERFAAPVARLSDQRDAANMGLVAWVKNHRYLQPAELDQGETGMALLLLWEVDHNMPFPSQGSRDRSPSCWRSHGA